MCRGWIDTSPVIRVCDLSSEELTSAAASGATIRLSLQWSTAFCHKVIESDFFHGLLRFIKGKYDYDHYRCSLEVTEVGAHLCHPAQRESRTASDTLLWFGVRHS